MTADSLHGASAIRSTVIGLWLANLLATPYQYYASLPDEMRIWRGLGGAVLASPAFRVLINACGGLAALKWLAVGTGTVLLLWPYRCRFLMPVFFGLVLVLDAASKSLQGYADHAQLLPLILLAVFTAYTNARFIAPFAGSKPVRRGTERSYDLIVLLAVLVLVIPYMFIGINRLIEGGIAVFSGDALLTYIRVDSLRDSTFGFTLFVGWTEIPVVAVLLKIGFAFTTAFEIMSPGIFVWPRFRFAWMVAMTVFHFMTLFSMNIFFWQNLILIYVVVGFGLVSVRSQKMGPVLAVQEVLN